MLWIIAHSCFWISSFLFQNLSGVKNLSEVSNATLLLSSQWLPCRIFHEHWVPSRQLNHTIQKHCAKVFCKKTVKWNFLQLNILIKHSKRSLCQTVSQKGVLKNFVIFPEKQLGWSLFFNEDSGLGLRPATLLKKRFQHRCFPVNFAKFLRAPT